jgi:hypothetical protein
MASPGQMFRKGGFTRAPEGGTAGKLKSGCTGCIRSPHVQADKTNWKSQSRFGIIESGLRAPVEPDAATGIYSPRASRASDRGRGPLCGTQGLRDRS